VAQRPRDLRGDRVGPFAHLAVTVAESPIRVFVLDDHDVVRRGLVALLDVEDDLSVVGEAGTAEEAISQVPVIRPDVAVLDVRLPDGDGAAVCRQLRSLLPELKCLMLTGYADDEALASAILAGASGYVLKQIRGSEIVSTVRRVAAGESVLDPALSRQVMDRIRGGRVEDELLAGLSAKERNIVELIGEGKSNRQIAEELSIAEKTVKNYVSSLLRKMGFARRTEAGVYVARVLERQSKP
jgi:two-component system, NarL family, response regulator DevR